MYPKHLNERVAGITLNQVELLHCTGDCNIKGIDKELIDFQGFIGLVAGPHVFEIAVQIFQVDPVCYFLKTNSFIRDEVHQNNVLVLKSLCFLNTEQKGRIKKLAHNVFFLVAHNQHGEFGGAPDLLVQFPFCLIRIFHEDNLAGLFR